MTANNVIVQRDAAHLITDAASYDDDGVVLGIETKAFVFPHLNAAVAATGRASAAILKTIFDTRPCATQCALKAVMADAVALMTAANVKALRERKKSTKSAAIRLAGIAWNPDKDRPEGWVVSSMGAGPAGTTDGRLFVTTSGGWLAPSVPNMGDYDDRWNDLDPEMDGREILETQRRALAPDGPFRGRFHAVGGFGERISVTKAGLSWSTIIEWPEDTIGQPIRPVLVYG